MFVVHFKKNIKVAKQQHSECNQNNIDVCVHRFFFAATKKCCNRFFSFSLTDVMSLSIFSCKQNDFCADEYKYINMCIQLYAIANWFFSRNPNIEIHVIFERHLIVCIRFLSLFVIFIWFLFLFSTTAMSLSNSIHFVQLCCSMKKS